MSERREPDGSREWPGPDGSRERSEDRAESGSRQRHEPGDFRERHEHRAERGSPQRHEQEHPQSHAGNGTVNHGPDDKRLEGLDGPGRHDQDNERLDGFGEDELDLRRMLHSAVEDLQPRDDTLDRLRRAVPARRARRRHAAVGMAAAALFAGTAVPALVHVSHSGGASPDTSIAGDASQAQGGAGQGKAPNGATSTGRGGSDQVAPPVNGGKQSDSPDQGHSTGTGPPDTAGPSATPGTIAPVCTAAQLGAATAGVQPADSTGVVYGTFRVTNVSGDSCTVGGAGTVSVVAQGAADPTRISAVRHVAGDAAAGLPAPSQESTDLLLLPGAAYEEKFAFVPSETCPPATGPGDGSTGGGPTTDPSPSTDPAAVGGTSDGGAAGTSTQPLTVDSTADGSIQVSNTTQAGTPTVSATVPDACAGTVYWTGVLADPVS
jgi:hypothetical protein